MTEINKKIVFDMHHIIKSFNQVEVLKGVDFTLYAGEVHCLVGENGAGKSTLCKIIAGIYPANGGSMTLFENSYNPLNVKEAQLKGIGFIHQELLLVSELTVLENIFLGSEKHNIFGQMKWREMFDLAKKVIEELELDISPDAKISSLSLAQQQMVEIAKAIIHNYKIIIFDEPTASISRKNTETLFRVIHQLKAKGVGMVYISHRLEEFNHIADRITVLRDGVRTGTMLYKDTDNNEIIRLMVGRDIKASDEVDHTNFSHIKLKVCDLQNAHVKKISFNVHQGEILGFAGLVGAGRTEILRAIFGADESTGDIYIDDIKQKIRSPKDAVKAGIGFLTEDRKGQGLVLGASIRKNVTLPILHRLWNGLFINQSEEKICVQKNMEKLRIVASSQEQTANTLSGGNQQKVVLARWMESNVKILFFDEPTRGIDVGAKAEIYDLMRAFTKDGGTVVMVSSDLPELLLLSNRIIVMRQGSMVGEVLRKDASEEKLMHLMVGI
ncbi:sugar ABC transporter ATP-binding protein [Morganella psychrotolerans]|uniref:Sugar ABC transporter ATP-binding protein n=1 Tax=Morganella psychrotolerans TaxID=368603 RepID=A0A1B8HMX2_9GAMM|nr:sugar ABC transporter ATP-binding protein [Morganella psychrotolerans]OBU10684.1 sugar ABC transporter ATP-binding protein [Morganella psychrotolerans]